MFILQADISIAEPIEVQIDELGNNITQMYQLIVIISGEEVPGLASVLNHMNENFSINTTQPYMNTIIALLTNNITKKHITYTI